MELLEFHGTLLNPKLKKLIKISAESGILILILKIDILQIKNSMKSLKLMMFFMTKIEDAIMMICSDINSQWRMPIKLLTNFLDSMELQEKKNKPFSKLISLKD